MARRRGLSPEDRELWSRAMKGTTPLHAVPRQSKPDETPAPAKNLHMPGVPRAQNQPAKTAPVGGALPARLPGKAGKPVHPAGQTPAQPLRMDRKTHKQMSRGKLRPEARIDLHGMTLAEAGPELASFILSCHARGLRLVLVITGKGRGKDPGPLPTRPGALRHQVPYWLHHPPLAQIVQQVTSAHLRHGGEGAYYVYLRR